MKKDNDLQIGDTFNEVYKNMRWSFAGNGSGPGSTLQSTVSVRNFLETLIRECSIKSIVDISCGGMCWWPILLEKFPDIKFYGFDVASIVIKRNQEKFSQQHNWKFQVADASCIDTVFPKADLILCRQTINHLSISDAQSVVKKMFSSSARYVGLTHFPHISDEHLRTNEKVPLIGGLPQGYAFRNMNLELEPFKCPPPWKFCSDAPFHSNGIFGVWKI